VGRIREGRLLPAKEIDLQPTPGRATSAATASSKSNLNEAPPFGAARKSPAAAAPLDETDSSEEDHSRVAAGNQRAANDGQSYTVAANDTYWTIAQKTYGSGAYFKALYEHNRRRLEDADQLTAGTQLLLPDEATLQRLYPSLCPRSQRVAANGRATRTSAEVPASNGTYVVKEGDTLYEVARRQLGRSARWAEIYELNRDAIGGVMDRLEPGTRLVLPENAAAQGSSVQRRIGATGFGKQ
jgi:nucleoid-associated protein YgaU